MAGMSNLGSVKLSQIKPYKNNPRDNADAIGIVANSLREFGFLVPILIDVKGVIIAGHTRYAAAKLIYSQGGRIKRPDGSLLPKGEVLILRANGLTSQQVRAFRVIDNKTAEAAEWDADKLMGEVAAILKGDEFTLQDYGFTDDDLNMSRILGGDTEALPNVDEDEVTIAPRRSAVLKKPKSIRVTIGEIRFHVPIKVYETWEQKIRRTNRFDNDRVIASVAKTLGLEYVGQVKPQAKSPRRKK